MKSSFLRSRNPDGAAIAVSPELKNSAFSEFIGKQKLRVVDSADRDKTTCLVLALNKGELPKAILDQQFTQAEGGADALARCATAAFESGQITQHQVSTLLQLRQITEITSQYQQLPIESKEVSEAETQERFSMMRHFMPEHCDYEDFGIKLKSLPYSEQTYFQITIDTSKIQEPGILNLLEFADKLRVIYFSPQWSDELTRLMNPPLKPLHHTLQFSILSAGALDLATSVRFDKHVAKEQPRLGELKIEDIHESMRMKSRCIAYSHPDVPVQPIFHDIEAPAFYLSLHDQLHRQLSSTIPNPIYKAYQQAIQLVQAKTGVEFSKDLRRSIDGEIGVFLDLKQSQHELRDIKILSLGFCEMLSAEVFSTHAPLALFSADEASLDTTLILMIDIYENSSRWLQLGIDASYFSKVYRDLYQLVSENSNILENKDTATRVAHLKALKARKSLPEGQSQFLELDGYLQVQVNGRTQGPTKARKVALALYEQALLNLNHRLTAMADQPALKAWYKKGRAVVKAIDGQMSPWASTCPTLFSRGKNVPLDKIHYYTQCLETTNLFLSPIGQRSKRITKKYATLIKEGEGKSVGKKVLGAMLAFLGLVTMVISAALIIPSLGLSAPASLVGLSLGAAATIGGIGLFKRGMRQPVSAAMLGIERQARRMGG